MDNVALQQIRDIIGKNDKIAIAVGRSVTVDDMAAALSLYLSLLQMRKQVTIASASQPTVELSSLVGINKVASQFAGSSGDLIVSFPYKEGEIEKVSYTIDNGYLNIVVKAGEQGLSFQETDVRYIRGGGAPSVLFVIGTPRLSDLGTLFDPEALKNTTIVNIDNKAENQGFGDAVLVSQNASSVSELVANLLSFIGVDLDIDVAQNLLSGISFATGNFQDPKTTGAAFEMAGILMKKGAVRMGGVTPTRPTMPRNNFMQQPQPPMQTQTQPRPQMQQQSEDRVSTFMPETMKASSPQMPRQPFVRQQQQQPQPQQQQTRDRKPPSDWLTPKVYKGSDKLE